MTTAEDLEGRAIKREEARKHFEAASRQAAECYPAVIERLAGIVDESDCVGDVLAAITHLRSIAENVVSLDITSDIEQLQQLYQQPPGTQK